MTVAGEFNGWVCLGAETRFEETAQGFALG